MTFTRFGHIDNNRSATGASPTQRVAQKKNGLHLDNYFQCYDLSKNSKEQNFALRVVTVIEYFRIK